METKAILALATKEDRPAETAGGYEWYSVNPGDLYPIMADYAKAVFAGQASTGLTYHIKLLAYQSRLDELTIPVTAVATQEQLAARAFVLETLRQWFTRMLKESIAPAPLGLHITRDQDWRLNPTPAQWAARAAAN